MNCTIHLGGKQHHKFQEKTDNHHNTPQPPVIQPHNVIFKKMMIPEN